MIRLILSFFFLLVPATDVAFSDQNSSLFGTLTGRIMLDEKTPMPGGKVVVFRKGSGPPPQPSRYLRPPDQSAEIRADGTFSMMLSAEEFYVTAIYKPGENFIGPPAVGDYVFPSPALLQEGKSIYHVKAGKTTDIGTVEAVHFSKDDLPQADEITAIRGQVTDKKGQPVAGAIVFAFDSPNTIGKPMFVSEKTDDEGWYELRVNKGGTYFTKMRAGLRGGEPTEGELIGSYGDPVPKPVSLETGQMRGDIDIQARRYKSTPNLSRGKSHPKQSK